MSAGLVAKNDSVKAIEDSLISTPTALKDKLGSFSQSSKGENVEYIIEPYAYSGNVFGNLSLKIGMDKLYIVKNMKQQ